MTSPTPLPSNRSFGTVFIVFFSLLGALSWWRNGAMHPWLFALAGLTLVVTLAVPSLLSPLNQAWMKLAEALHRVMSPLILGIMFYGLITPIALVMRLRGRDPLHRRFDTKAGSYWITREPPGPSPESLPNQF